MLLGMSQEKLADVLGLTFQQVQKYEKGVNRIGAGRLQQIAEALDVSVSYFYEDVSRESPATSSKLGDLVSAVLGSPDTIRASKAFSKIADPRVRRQIVELLEVLSESSHRA